MYKVIDCVTVISREDKRRMAPPSSHGVMKKMLISLILVYVDGMARSVHFWFILNEIFMFFHKAFIIELMFF